MEGMDHIDEDVSGDLSPETAPRGAPVVVTLFECGAARDVEAYEGESLMVALKRAGLPLLAVCGGRGACGTCKVAFPSEWALRLNEPEKRELRLLTHIKAQDGERLSCRISLTAELNGLEVDACD
jgi:ferredoxin